MLKFITILLLICLSNFTYSKPKPRNNFSSKIIETLKRLEKQKRTGRGGLKLDTKTFDFLHRKSIVMSVDISEFQRYIFENRKNTEVLDAIERLFEISNSAQTPNLKKMLTNKLLGLLVRLDANKRSRFKIKANHVLEAIETWKVSEIQELKKMMLEVALEAESENMSPNKALLEILNPVYHEQIKRKCL